MKQFPPSDIEKYAANAKEVLQVMEKMAQLDNAESEIRRDHTALLNRLNELKREQNALHLKMHGAEKP